MAKHESTTYACDKCGKNLPTCDNNMDIKTVVSEPPFWRHIHVRVFFRSGTNNDGKETKADLCQDCACNLLQDALGRVKNGERVTKGVDSSHEKVWDGV